MQSIIRDARESDDAAIREVVRAAFGGVGEADLVDALRRPGDLAVSLVADHDGAVIGHLGLSRLRSPPDGLALAPLSVAPDFQRRGIGGALVEASLERGRGLGYAIVFVLGDPAYYGRFGFSAGEAERYASPYAGPHFMCVLLRSTVGPPAPVIYPPAFDALS